MTNVSVVIVTYQRERVLLDTLQLVLSLEPPAAEVLVIDQTNAHEAATEATLSDLEGRGLIRWLRLPRPSIPRAMNEGLIAASQSVVLFLDDDLIPDVHLIQAHSEAHVAEDVALVSGRVIQPWDQQRPGQRADLETRECGAEEVMGGNLSIKREAGLAAGGFDENFVRVAYRFEADFAERILQEGYRSIVYPAAIVRHLKADRGGTRSYGEHMRTLGPAHSVGAYYYLLRSRRVRRRVTRILRRMVGSVRTKFHLRHPWWIPLTLIAEMSGLAWAAWLAMRGPRLVSSSRRQIDADA